VQKIRLEAMSALTGHVLHLVLERAMFYVLLRSLTASPNEYVKMKDYCGSE
jgi:hypothetical protein